MTRGRHANHLYLATAGDGNPHTVITRDALLPPSPVAIVTRILDRDGSAISATTHTRTLTDPLEQLAPTADRYYDALSTAAESHLGPTRMSTLDRTADTTWPGLTDQPAWPTLRAKLAIRLLTTTGRTDDEPFTAEVVDAAVAADLRHAIESREIDAALDAAAVLDWRLDYTGNPSAPAGPLGWLPGVPEALAGDPEWGPSLARRQDEVQRTAAAVHDLESDRAPTCAPSWAVPMIDTDSQLVADLAVWRAANQIPDTDYDPPAPRCPTSAGPASNVASMAALPGSSATRTPSGVAGRRWPPASIRGCSPIRTGLFSPGDSTPRTAPESTSPPSPAPSLRPVRCPMSSPPRRCGGGCPVTSPPPPLSPPTTPPPKRCALTGDPRWPTSWATKLQGAS